MNYAVFQWSIVSIIYTYACTYNNAPFAHHLNKSSSGVLSFISALPISVSYY